MIPIYTPNENDESFNMGTQEEVIEEKLKQTKQVLDLIEPMVPKLEKINPTTRQVEYSTANIIPRLKMAADQLYLPIAVGAAIITGPASAGAIVVTMARGVAAGLGLIPWSKEYA
tara:strand:+ start:2260 stop:2604 length:345 start_codon:yes stop_codon:yes gene_type:complete